MDKPSELGYKKGGKQTKSLKVIQAEIFDLCGQFYDDTGGVKIKLIYIEWSEREGLISRYNSRIDVANTIYPIQEEINE